ncbi:hypothetical protein XA67_22975 [Comamonas thiooxydans]|nr:hypothetical protein XA67_22975 [Comamonas thiooxydans]
MFIRPNEQYEGERFQQKKRLKRRFLLLTIRYRHGVYVPKDLRLTLLHLGLLPLRKDSLHVIN